MRSRRSLWLILLFYGLIAALYATYTPEWEAPDEPAHYNYVRQLASGRLPVMEPGDYDQEYLFEVVFESHFAPQFSIEPLEYEDWQPPLYYLLLTPVFLLSGGSLLAMRLFSALIGAGVVALSYLITERLFPLYSWMAMTTAVFVAFLPQHVAILASVNNDSLAELLIAAILLAAVDLTRKKRESASVEEHGRALVLIGGLLGLGFLTKGTVYPLALIVAIALVLRYGRDYGRLARAGARVILPALLLGSLWWGRNIYVYGGLDALGKSAHDAVVVGQPLTRDLVDGVGLGGAARSFVRTTFNSFWGQFGWMTVPLPSWAYRPLWAFSGVVAAGLIIAVGRYRKYSNRNGHDPALILISLFVLTVVVYVGYNLTFQQHQGRYLFPALVPIGIGVGIALGSWLQLADRQRRIPAIVLPTGLFVALVSLDLWALISVIIPALT